MSDAISKIIPFVKSFENWHPIGVFVGSSLLIMGIEDLVKRFQDSGRLGHLDRLEKSKYANITFVVGFSSLLLEITRNFII